MFRAAHKAERYFVDDASHLLVKVRRIYTFESPEEPQMFSDSQVVPKHIVLRTHPEHTPDP